MLSRIAWRRFRFGLQTIMGLPARGFFIPYRYAESVPDTQPVYKELEAVFDAKQDVFTTFCQSLDEYADVFARFQDTPKWQQDWFPRLDGAAAYGLVRQHKPKTIIEVGSGHSTRFMAQAAKDAGLDCTQIAIDPFPRAKIKTLPITWQAELLNETHLTMFANLEAGDIAFFDSSHILMPGTDVDMILNRILPVLKKGVLIHIHDVLLPDPYPEQWLWRGYNEQNALGPMIANGAYDVVFASAYVATRMENMILQTKLADIPLFKGAVETSLWLMKP
ncbi:class I SAM-dependent methyltransferase [Amylibacter sp. SFDW26]|uniref:class I SAM-dependent methyltransferase n=1 Tax=Amylibacter sp. SFDW26 TaxID=2652722 RepID=UPI0012627F08|nr:class I SAM-dependent methyltransferase [Amylibacter sp. SFDW26]KAB7616147.1 class I SAM-dependent methyltransferase [Amylibacter sp. SFDW26]